MTKKFRVLFLTLACLGLLVSCGDDDETTNSQTVTSYTYNGAVTPATSSAKILGVPSAMRGEFSYGWEITVNSDGTFSLSGGSDMEISGTHTTLDSGLLKFTVGEASGTDAPESGEEGYGLHIPGFVLMMAPIGSEGDLIPMVYAGTCPSEDYNINYILASRGNAGELSACVVGASAGNSLTGNELAVTGVGSFDVSEGTFTSTERYDICNNEISCAKFRQEACRGGCEWDTDEGICKQLTKTFTCSDGIADIKNDAGDLIYARLYLTANGGAIIGTNIAETDGTTLLGFPGDEISSGSSLDGEYVGITYLPGSSTTQETTALLNVTIATASETTTMTVTKVDPDTGEDTGELENAVITISAVDTNATGFFTGTFSIGGEVKSYVQCSADLAVNGTSKNMINCILQRPCEDEGEVSGPAGTACVSGKTNENGNFVIVTK